MDSAPPVWKVATLSVRGRRFCDGGAAMTVGVFSSEDDTAAVVGGVIVFRFIASVVIDIESICADKTCAALTRGVGRLSR